MNAPIKNVTGFVLAGGKSSRMGEDKGLMLLHDKKMAAYVIDTLTPCVDEVIIISNKEAYNQFGLRLLKDLVTDRGPAAGIYTGLHYSRTNLNFFVSCDMPFISAEVINYLISLSPGWEITVPISNDKIHPLCGIYSKTCLPVFEQHINAGKLKLKELILQFTHTLVNMDTFSQDHAYLFQNINTHVEFEEAVRELEKRK